MPHIAEDTTPPSGTSKLDVDTGQQEGCQHRTMRPLTHADTIFPVKPLYLHIAYRKLFFGER